MADINATIPLLEPVSYTFREVLRYIEFFVGGIFGLYLITLVVRLVFFRKIYKSFEEIRDGMKRMESKIDKFKKK